MLGRTGPGSPGILPLSPVRSWRPGVLRSIVIGTYFLLMATLLVGTPVGALQCRI